MQSKGPKADAEQDTSSAEPQSITLNDEQADAFLKAFPCVAGDILKVKVTSLDTEGPSLTLAPADESEDSESPELAGPAPTAEETEEKILGYKRPVSQKPAPPFGAKELQD